MSLRLLRMEQSNGMCAVICRRSFAPWRPTTQTYPSEHIAQTHLCGRPPNSNPWNRGFLYVRYTNLLTSCKLTAYLADINERAEDMFFRLVKQLAEKEGVTEHLKADNQMLWVKHMNNTRNRAEEIVNAELIYK